MEELKLLQNITPVVCPHCSNTIFVSFHHMFPVVANVFNEGEVQIAKEEVREKVKGLNLTDEEMTRVEEYLADPTTLLSRQDVDTVVENIKNSHDSSTQPQTS